MNDCSRPEPVHFCVWKEELKSLTGGSSVNGDDDDGGVILSNKLEVIEINDD